MAIEITVPRLGWSMDEGTFAEWLKREGDFVRKGEMLFVLEGDKAAQEIETFDEGILKLLSGGPKPGDKVQVGQVLGHLLAKGEAAPVEASPLEADPLAATVVASVGETSSPVHVSQSADVPSYDRGPKASPRAKRRAAELGVDWTSLAGTGSTGRIRERDVNAALSPNVALSLRERKRDISRSEMATIQPLSVIRRTIAERMVASHLATAPVTLTTTADATNLVALRRQFQSAASAANGTVPSYSDFLMKLTALALKSHPALNARWEEGHIATFAEVNMGLAVDTDAGLLVPVIRGVERLSLRSVAQRSRELVERARSGRLAPDDMQGGTFTITNLGAFGIDAFTPIINSPECAILGVGRIVKQPVYLDNQFVPRDIISLSLTFDHRLVDGAPAARFLQTLCQAIENPAERLIA